LKKLSPTASVPEYKTEEAAGADLTPNVSGMIKKWSTKKVPTGIAVEIPKGYHGKIEARSSLTEQGISITGIIDSDYRGEILLTITNHNPYEISYQAGGNAIAQLIIQPHIQVKYKIVETLTPTARKGGFGSTNIDAITIHPGKLVFEGSLKGKKTQLLIDSGADGVFCGKNTAKGLKLTELKKPITITLADGQEHAITKVAKDIPYTIQGFKDKLDLYVMPTDHDQVILGNHWLDRLNPKIDWRKKEVSITRDGKTHTLQVNTDSKNRGCKEIQVNYLSADDDFKLDEEDQLLLVHMTDDIDEELGIIPISQPDTDDPDLQKLLHEYQDVFRTELPSEKPTKRDVEHVIRLKEGAKPRNARQF
jgi:dUTP pyrophosphatase